MYKHILLAVDGSKNSLRATEEAIKIASLVEQCVVEVLFVIDYSVAKNEVLHATSKESLDMERRKKLLPIEEQLKINNLSYQIKILYGEPGPTIVEYANNGHVELVVIGSRGLNTLQEMVLGSVSHKVAKRVTCPVLIVK
ncbi:universal stress protein [Brevibacillus halotolerans]|uniref:universal stress protein n=1 Tax=Brevibacillus halotolerans TaxID=1507437 RepID=UPI001B2678AA|nr:universal stress protein [Brevibacillus halotolerans]GIO02566.1 universal stress protein [Brevibacillus halotolerans]